MAVYTRLIKRDRKVCEALVPIQNWQITNLLLSGDFSAVSRPANMCVFLYLVRILTLKYADTDFVASHSLPFQFLCKGGGGGGELYT